MDNEQLSEKLLSVLGLCRAANKASFGHNAAKAALREHRARLCLLCGDASPRLCEEFEYLADQGRAPLCKLPLSSSDIKQATQYKAAVLTINDRGFADKITALFNA